MKLKNLRKLNAVMLFFLLGFFLVSCGGGGSGGGQGILSTSLTDSSTDEYQAIYVTITRVEVHHDGDGTWETVANPDKTYNLLELVNGVRETLGISSLAVGHYTQLRLIIGEVPDVQGLNIFSMPHPYANYLINQADEIHELKVPSGTNTGLKIVNGFDINENQTTELLLDFDALRSVVKAGSSGHYLLKPTVKVLDTAGYAIVSGTVSNAETSLPIVPGGALVTAQTSALASPDAKDQVVLEAGTLADENHNYALFLAPGDYVLVASHAGYLTGCAAVSLPADSLATVDFSLTAATVVPGTIAGLVTIANAPEEQTVTIDFRQEVTCVDAANPTLVTVTSVNIANGGAYAVDLPAGNYQVVASTVNAGTRTAEATVVSAETTPVDLAF
jgi:Domain of unknown function (DUF4382)